MGINTGTITYGSKIAGFSKTINKLEKLDQKFQGVANTAVNKSDSVNKLTKDTQQLADKSKQLSEDANNEANKLTKLKNKIRDTGIESTVTTNRLGDLTNKIVAGASKVKELTTNFTGLTNAIRGLGITSALTGLGASIKSGLVGVGSTITGTISGSILGSTAGIISAGASIGALIGGAAVRGLQVAGILDKVGELGTKVRKIVGGDIVDTFLGLATAGSPILAPFVTLGSFIDGFIKGLFTDGLTGAISQGLNKAGQSVQLFKDKWLSTFKPIIGKGKQLLSFINDIKNGVADINLNDLIPDLNLPQLQAPDLNLAGNNGNDTPQTTTTDNPTTIVQDETSNKVEQDITVNMESKVDPRNLTEQEIKEFNEKLDRQAGEDLTDRLG